MAKQSKQVPVTLMCDKCKVETISTTGSSGKKHKKCGGRSAGHSKKECGVWR